MGFLKKRKTALAILIAVIIFGTLFGVHRTVNNETEKIEEQFYSGVRLDTYNQASIDDMLDERAKNALGIVTLLSDKLPNEADSVRTAREKLINAESIEEKYIANEELSTALEALKDASLTVDLTERESEGLDMYAENIESAQKVIDSSDYNSLVDEFRNVTLKSFPVNFISKIAFCDYPSYFGLEG